MGLNFDLAAVKRCIECRGCEHDCPSFMVLPGFNPTKVNIDILAGRVEEWLSKEMIWQCLECHACTERCPQKYSWETVLTTLKKEALSRGMAPEPVVKGWQMLFKSGRLGEPRIPPRQRLGLPAPMPSGIEDLKRLFPEVFGGR